MKKRVWIWDIETLDIFTSTFLDRDSDEVRSFVISKSKDERESLFIFLDTEVAGLIGFNSIYFDAQVIEYMYRNPNCSAEDIRRYAGIITENNDRKVDVPEWNLRHKHLDLFKINHFDNKNRRTGLKWCEFQMDLDNIEDMPSQGEGDNWEKMVLSYNLNDVIATKELYKRTIPAIELRKKIIKKYNIPCLNYSNTKLGSELLLDLYCKRTGKYKQDVKSLRTNREWMLGKDIVFDYIKFESKEFNSILDLYKNIKIHADETNKKKTKEEEDLFSIKYKNFKFDYGLGGIHGSLNDKIITSDENNVIIDADVASLYPNIAIANELYPEHLGKEFYQVYKEDIVDVRIAEKHKKELGDKAIIDGFKESANATYGNSNMRYSWLYDPLYTMKTTINGQLIISMLCERLLNEISNILMIQANTDGITIKLPKTEVEKYYSICNEWMKFTKWELEYAEYSKMVIKDINNYLAIYTSGKTKCKGSFEFENIPLHKNKSHNIIPIAVYNYFVKGIGVEDTIYNHRNIFDFCAGVKASKSPVKGKSWFELKWLDKDKIATQKLSKTVRYFISKKGKYLFKAYEDGTSAHVEAPLERKAFKKDWKVTYFNKAYYPNDFKEYDIDYVYYFHKAKDIIFNIEGNVGQQTINF